MYSKYDEMCVMKQVIKNYADNQKSYYESSLATLKEKLSSFPLDINSDRVSSEIGSLQRDVGILPVIRNDYQSALLIVSELSKATMCYEQAYTLEQLQQGEIAEQRAKEGNKIFYEIRTQNPEYKRIVDEISYSLFTSHDPHLDGLGMDYEAKAESLEKDFETGKITKEQLIYYTIVCWSLSQNPNYVECMEQGKTSQGIHK